MCHAWVGGVKIWPSADVHRSSSGSRKVPCSCVLPAGLLRLACMQACRQVLPLPESWAAMEIKAGSTAVRVLVEQASVCAASSVRALS